jgi:NAD(P)H-dependent FMN reductase
MILVVSASLRPESNSRILAHEALRVLREDKLAAELLDLRDHPIPLCDGTSTFSHPSVGVASRLLAAAEGIVVATPVYNYDANAVIKNLIEHTGRDWEDKTVGFLCAAGGMGSYMSIMSLANSLMLDFRTLIVPRFVYAMDDAFDKGVITDPKIANRVAELARATARLAKACKSA